MTIAIVVGIFLLVLLGTYNSLIVKKNQVQNAYGGLDAILQKRYDLVPNLVATVQGYMKHEHNLLAQVVRLRASAANGATARLRHEADEALTSALNQIFVLTENYPELRAGANLLQLQAALNEIEEQISAARRAFNAAVTDYNNAVQTFPGSLLANAMGLGPKQWFEIADAQRGPVNIIGTLSG